MPTQILREPLAGCEAFAVENDEDVLRLYPISFETDASVHFDLRRHRLLFLSQSASVCLEGYILTTPAY